jgi:uncharacterized protein YqfA (UPF0365 family)
MGIIALIALFPTIMVPVGLWILGLALYDEFKR